MSTDIRLSARFFALNSLVCMISSSLSMPTKVALRWNPGGTTHSGSFCMERDKAKSVLPSIEGGGEGFEEGNVFGDGKYDCTGALTKSKTSQRELC